MFTMSQTTGYAILALSCLNEPGKPWVMAKEIAERISVPLPYLSKILHHLSQSGLILAKRGYRGGFTLACPASQITLLQIAHIIEGPDCLPQCFLGIPDCQANRLCPTFDFWKIERRRIEDMLKQLTLSDVVDHRRPAHPPDHSQPDQAPAAQASESSH